MVAKVSIFVVALAVCGAVAVVGVWWFVWRTLEVHYAVDSSANESVISETIAEIELLNPTLRFIEADGQPDFTFEFANLNNGVPARFQNANVSINATHIGCRNQTTDYTRNVLLNHTNTGIQQYLATATMREIAFPPVHSTANNALVGEAQMRSQIATLQRDITLIDSALDEYRNADNIAFADWGDYADDLDDRNSIVRDYGRAVDELNCLLAVGNAFESYAMEAVRDAVITYSFTFDDRNSERAEANRAAIAAAVRGYEAVNPNLTFEFVDEFDEGARDLTLGFSNLSNGTPALRSGTDEVTINRWHNSCQNGQTAYTEAALTNHSIQAIGQYITFHTGTTFGQPRLANVAGNEVAGEQTMRERIAALQRDITADDNFLAQYRLVDRIPFREWAEYTRRRTDRNDAAEDYNEVTTELECLLNVSASTFRTFGIVASKRREGRYNFALDPTALADANFVYREAAREAIEMWEHHNDVLDFTEVDANSTELDFYIDFIDIPESEGYVGLHCRSGCSSERWRPATALPAGDYAEILMDTEAKSCRNESVPFVYLYYVDVVMHEIGHFLGLGHSTDTRNLLFGISNPNPMPIFDDLGWDIPPIPRWDYQREGVERLVSILDSITVRFEVRDGRTVRIVSNLSQANEVDDEIDCIGRHRNQAYN